MIPIVPSAGHAAEPAPLPARRVLWIAALVGAWALLVAWRLVDLQVLQRDSLGVRARRQHERTVQIEALRGRLLDREGRPLAQSLEVPSLYADPSAIPDAGSAAARLAPILRRNARDIARDLR